MILSLLIIVFSLHASAEQATRPYSPTPGGLAAFSQYQQDYYSVSNKTAIRPSCEDPNWDGQCVCEEQKQKIDWVQKHGQPLNVFNWSKIRSKKLVMIGDAHGVSNPDSIVDLMKLSRSDSGKQCVFFEMSSDWSSDKFLKLLGEKTGDAQADQLRRYYTKIANGALEQGFSLFMVDDPRNWSGDRNVSDTEREVHMATTIKSLFSNRKCDHAILVVGKAHVAGSNLPNLLTLSDISLARLNPIFAPNEGRSAPTEEWNGLCTNQKFTPTEALIFGNSGIKNHWVTPGFSPDLLGMMFGNFDYSILFPEAQFERKFSGEGVSRPVSTVRSVR